MKSRKRAWPGALLIAVAALSAPVVAKSDAANPAEITLKIGGVDFQKLLLNSAELKRSMNLLKEQFESERKQLLQMQHDLKVHPEDAQLQQQFSTQAADFRKRAESACIWAQCRSSSEWLTTMIRL
jgi:Skp family chaperone for outer membrane proteins